MFNLVTDTPQFIRVTDQYGMKYIINTKAIAQIITPKKVKPFKSIIKLFDGTNIFAVEEIN